MPVGSIYSTSGWIVSFSMCNSVGIVHFALSPNLLHFIHVISVYLCPVCFVWLQAFTEEYLHRLPLPSPFLAPFSLPSDNLGKQLRLLTHSPVADPTLITLVYLLLLKAAACSAWSGTDLQRERYWLTSSPAFSQVRNLFQKPQSSSWHFMWCLRWHVFVFLWIRVS